MKKFLSFIVLFISLNTGFSTELPPEVSTLTYYGEQPSTRSRLYPNPAENFIIVKNSTSVKIKNISILSMVGSNMFYKNISDSNVNQEINVSNLSTGRYFVKISYSDGNQEILTLIKL